MIDLIGWFLMILGTVMFAALFMTLAFELMFLAVYLTLLPERLRRWLRRVA